MESISNIVKEIGKKAKLASSVLAEASTEAKNRALKEAAEAIKSHEKEILEANHEDVEQAKAKGLDKAMIDRLILNPSRVASMAKAIVEIAKLPDPVGKILSEWQRPNGLKIFRVSIPLGVIGIIYESRPNVTADAGALCLKSGNAAILRGGSESFNSSTSIMKCLQEGLEISGLPKDVLQLIPTQDRAAVGELLKLSEYIDVIVPRGGKGLIKRVIEESRIPVFQHLDGNCNTYIHEKADPEMAKKIVLNAKMRRTGICGATENLVIDEIVAPKLLPAIADLLTERNCEMRGDKNACSIDKRIIPARDEDWDKEYLDAIIAIKTVKDLSGAIEFINTHGSHHTDAIVTEDKEVAELFLKKIESAIVMHNTSTQFADGGEFGMGAEIGISTGKLHARGPVGLEQLTTYKYMIKGTGQLRA